MTEYDRGYRDAMEAAARAAQLLPSGPWATEAEAIAAVTHAVKIAEHIRALSARIPPAPDEAAYVDGLNAYFAGKAKPAPDDEALVELAEGCIVNQPTPMDAARAVLAALREAGALRHE